MSDADAARELQAIYEKTKFTHCALLKEPVTCCGKTYYTEEGLRLHNHVSHIRKALRSVSNPGAKPDTVPSD